MFNKNNLKMANAKGSAGSVDLDSLEQMRVKYEEEISRSKSRGKEFCKHRADYKCVLIIFNIFTLLSNALLSVKTCMMSISSKYFITDLFL